MTFEEILIAAFLGIAFVSFIGGCIAACKSMNTSMSSAEYSQLDDLCGIFGGCMMLSLFLAAMVYCFAVR